MVVGGVYVVVVVGVVASDISSSSSSILYYLIIIIILTILSIINFYSRYWELRRAGSCIIMCYYYSLKGFPTALIQEPFPT